MEIPTGDRLATGLVYEPDVIDAEGCVYSAETIRAACERWNGENHDLGVVVVSSGIADADRVVGTTAVKAGSWLVTVRVDNDETWQQITSGALTGLSIGGYAVPESNKENDNA